MKYKDQLKDRILGCLLGGALGDTMGFATEGHHYKTVRAKYGLVNRLITRDFGDELTPPVTKPVYTDDTVMRHMVCRTIFDTDGYPTIEALAKVWRESITDFEHWHWWNNTRIIGAKLKWGQWLDLRNLGSDSIACNDASMIIAPVGLLNPCNPRLAALEALELSGLWQNSYSRDCAAAMAAAHSQAVSPDATIDTVIETAKKYSGKLAGYITRAIKLAEEVKSPETFTEEYYKRFVPGPNEDYWCGISSHKDGSPW
ncbi:MAG TPA: ADP-ribosylglycohydrolase family protein, partial [Methylococcales bacterium]